MLRPSEEGLQGRADLLFELSPKREFLEQSLGNPLGIYMESLDNYRESKESRGIYKESHKKVQGTLRKLQGIPGKL